MYFNNKTLTIYIFIICIICIIILILIQLLLNNEGNKERFFDITPSNDVNFIYLDKNENLKKYSLFDIKRTITNLRKDIIEEMVLKITNDKIDEEINKFNPFVYSPPPEINLDVPDVNKIDEIFNLEPQTPVLPDSQFVIGQPLPNFGNNSNQPIINRRPNRVRR